MPYRLLADAVVLLHLAFILFVVFGALLVMRHPRLLWLHLAAAFWGAGIEFTGGICPLTPLENRFRALGGDSPYAGDFIEHYLIPLIYPDNLTRGAQMLLGFGCLAINLLLYAWLFRRKRREKREREETE
ncbi:MAG: DUF2784 domain-containing protein [Thermodesulfobacteriota bacterium]